MNDNNSGPRQIIEEYVEACRIGSVDKLLAIFHPEALMSGYFSGEFYMGTPQPFYDEVRDVLLIPACPTAVKLPPWITPASAPALL